MTKDKTKPTEKRLPGRPEMAPAAERLELDPFCQNCHKNRRAKTTHLGKVYFRKYCHTCGDRKYKSREKVLTRAREKSKRDYKKFCESKMVPCLLCGFIPEHSCQMDVDHIDGNRYNNSRTNLQLLCANCHRLKTRQNKDYNAKKYSSANVELSGCGIIQTN